MNSDEVMPNCGRHLAKRREWLSFVASGEPAPGEKFRLGEPVVDQRRTAASKGEQGSHWSLSSAEEGRGHTGH